MQWSHIKTLFILSFLALNIYLVTALIDRQQDVGYLDNQELPIEDQLASENINYDAIEIDVTELPYISVQHWELEDEDIQALDSLPGQVAEVFQNNLIIAEIENEIRLDADHSAEELEELVTPNVLYGEEYTFWGWNEAWNVLIFFQTKEDRKIYYNENGVLLVFLDENNEMTHYTQTILGESEVQGNLIQLNQPTQVIGQLFAANYLQRNDTITDGDIGYYSRIAADGIQVFAPTWQVKVNDERIHFVNAIEGIVYESGEHEFIAQLVGEYLVRLHVLEDTSRVKESAIAAFEARIEIDNRSETE